MHLKMQKSNSESISKRMKKHRKLIISALVCLTGATLATSVTSTVAWFQYATRVTAAYTGTTAHCSKMLQVSVDNGAHWGTDLLDADLSGTETFEPITTGAQTKNTAISQFYSSPNYRQGLYSNWLTAPATSYSQFTLSFKSTDVDENYGTASETYLENDVFLTNLTIVNNGSIDLANAIRVHFDAKATDGTHKYFLFAKNVTSTSVGGYLDVNNDGKLDPAGYEWESGNCVYGGTGLVQTSYKAVNDADGIIATDTKGQLSGGTSFGKTSSSSSSYLEITVTIWLEGWALLNTGNTGNVQTSNTAVWNSATYASKDFNVGMTFGVQLHNASDHA